MSKLAPLKTKIAILAVVSALGLGSSCLAAGSDYRTWGLLGGLSFPKTFYLQIEYNIDEHWAVDYQPSLGIFWVIQQADFYYYFRRTDWSPYVGLGYQNWNFYGLSGSTSYDGVLFGEANSASAITLPFGLMYVAPSGFAFNVGLAIDVFVNAALGLQGKFMPEGYLGLGYFF